MVITGRITASIGRTSRTTVTITTGDGGPALAGPGSEDGLAGPVRPPQQRDQLDMRRITELVDRRHLHEPVAAIDENTRVAREGRGIARHGNDDRNCRGGERIRLCLRALP